MSSISLYYGYNVIDALKLLPARSSAMPTHPLDFHFNQCQRIQLLLIR